MIGSVLDAVTAATARVALHPDVCARNNSVFNVRKDCRRCQAACPADAIDLTRPAIAAPPCDGCGLCIPVCPTGAVTERGKARLESVDAWRRTGRHEPFVIACDLAGLPENTPLMQVRCLAAVRWENLAIPALLGTSSVELRRGRCGDCALGGRVGEAIDPTIRFAELFCAALGLCRIETREIPAPDRNAKSADQTDATPRRRFSRREIFTRIARGSHDTAGALGQSAVSELAGRLGLATAERPTDDVLWLRNLVVDLLAGKTAGEPSVTAGPQTGRPLIDKETCNRCAICVAACPTGALFASSGEAGGGGPAREPGLSLYSARCTGCASCERACREGAVRMASTVDLTEWGSGPVELLPPASIACRVCGAKAIGAMLPLCPRCHREGRGALSMTPAERLVESQSGSVPQPRVPEHRRES